MSSHDKPDVYATVARAVRVRIPVGACRFFASVQGVANEVEAKAFIAAVSQEFADATHNAWAYKIGHGEQAICRCSDAGEPTNTAGPPMLQAIEGHGLTNVVVVATRYFGGVKLGIGGLIRAYRDTALAGLEEAGVRHEVVLVPATIRQIDYACLGDVLREIERCGHVVNVKYGQRVLIEAMIRPKEHDVLYQRVRDITRGQGCLEVEAGGE